MSLTVSEAVENVRSLTCACAADPVVPAGTLTLQCDALTSILLFCHSVIQRVLSCAIEYPQRKRSAGCSNCHFGLLLGEIHRSAHCISVFNVLSKATLILWCSRGTFMYWLVLSGTRSVGRHGRW